MKIISNKNLQLLNKNNEINLSSNKMIFPIRDNNFNNINKIKENYNIEPMDVTYCDNRIDEINANININENYLDSKDTNLNMIDAKDLTTTTTTMTTTDAEMLSCDSIIEYKNLINNENNMQITQQECRLVESSQRNRMRIALGVLIRLVLPFCNGVARGWRGIRGVLKILKHLGASRHMLTNMLAYAANTISLSLSSVQVVHRIDPILKIMKLKKYSTTKCITSSSPSPLLESPSSFISSPEKRILAITDVVTDELEKSVTINILAEPPPGTPIRADIVFIHGLHGSLTNTWKQGLWNSEGRKENFKRPPKPPLRPPKRPRHSRSSIFIPPHLEKRPRYTESECGSIYDSYDSDSSDQENQVRSRHFSIDCGQPESIDYCEGMEFSFPTFRLRREEYHSESSLASQTKTRKNSNDESIKNTESQSQQQQHQQNKSNSDNNNSENYSKCWPSDWLPLDCPGVRVIALNYTTDPYLWRPLWVRKRNRTSLTERAREMTELLIEKRVGYGHPIIWVGHSKGGIFIKQIIVDAWESGRLTAAPLWRSSRGVFFYSVPHRGSPLADFNLPLLRQSIELIELQKNSATLLDLHRRFAALYQSGNLKIDVFSFVETALTLMSVLYLRIVGVDSADPGIGEVCGVHLDHREICKPRSRNCILYKELVKMINRVS